MVAALNFSRRSLVVAWTGLMLVGPLSLVACDVEGGCLNSWKSGLL